MNQSGACKWPQWTLLGAKTGEGSPSRARLGPWADTSSRAAVQALSQGGVPLPGPLVPGDNTDIPATPWLRAKGLSLSGKIAQFSTRITCQPENIEPLHRSQGTMGVLLAESTEPKGRKGPQAWNLRCARPNAQPVGPCVKTYSIFSCHLIYHTWMTIFQGIRIKRTSH